MSKTTSSIIEKELSDLCMTYIEMCVTDSKMQQKLKNVIINQIFVAFRKYEDYLKIQIPLIQDEAVRAKINKNILEDYLCSCPKCFASHHISRETQLAIVNDILSENEKGGRG